MKKNNLTIQKALEELETIVEWFDSQEALDIDKGIDHTKKGIELLTFLKQDLKEKENMFEELQTKFEKIDES